MSHNGLSTVHHGHGLYIGGYGALAKGDGQYASLIMRDVTASYNGQMSDIGSGVYVLRSGAWSSGAARTRVSRAFRCRITV